MSSAQFFHSVIRYVQTGLCIAVVLLSGLVLASFTQPPSALAADDVCDITTANSCTIIKDTSDPNWPNVNATTSTTVSGMVSETAVQLQGYAPPNAFIIVSEGADVVGAGTALADGTFSFTLHALQANLPHAISLVASGDSLVTPGTGFIVTPIPNTITTISNILLPTFIEVSPTAQNYSQPIIVSGDTVPGGTVTVFVEDPGENIIDTQVMADNVTGHWEVELIAAFGNLNENVYTTYAQVSYTGGLQSELSQVLQFEVRPVTATTFLTINGYGAPGAFLSFKNNGNPISTDVVPANGQFSKTLPFPDANASLVITIVSDNGEQITPETTFNTSVIMYQTTVVDDILLPTFISVNPNIAAVGEDIDVFGTTTPNASIALTVESPIQTDTLVVDGDGLWQDDLLDLFGTFVPGTYKAHAIVHITTINGPQQSVKSREVIFQVHEAETATDLIVEGFGAPGAFVSFIENQQVVGTTTININGEFSHVIKFPDVSLNRTVSVVADNGQQQTPATTFMVSLVAFNPTTISNIMLPTFVSVQPSQTPYGSTTIISGKTAPNSLVQVYIRNPIMDHPVVSNINGEWQIPVRDINNDNHLNIGKYLAYARAQKVPQGYLAGMSQEVEFEIVDPDDCSARRSDLNCDGLVDITDLGILIFYWGAAGSGQKADINQNGVVDISDVGILVYDWTY